MGKVFHCCMKWLLPVAMLLQLVSTGTFASDLYLEDGLKGIERRAEGESVVQLLSTHGFPSGSGTEDDPYLVSSAEDFMALGSYPGACFLQTCDISMDGHTMESIPVFTGVYDGGGYALHDLTLSVSSFDTALGLFGKNEGTIRGLHLEDSAISILFTGRHMWGGGLVGDNAGTVLNCSVSGQVTVEITGENYNDGEEDVLPEVYVGGIVGASTGIVENCANAASVLAITAMEGCVVPAGIVGYNEGTVINCRNDGDVSTEGAASTYCGGIVGYNTGTIKSVENTGSITGTGCASPTGYNRALCGGIVGQNKGTVSYARNYGAVESIATAEGKYAYCGGIVGYNGDTPSDPGPYVVEYSINYGTVHSDAANGYSRVGGIAATVYKNSYARYCCNQGDLTANSGGKYSSTYGGGIAATVQYGTISQCCNHGTVRLDARDRDSLAGCGIAASTDAVITDCYNTGDIYSDYKSKTNYSRLAGLFIDEGTTCRNSYNLGTLTQKYSSNPRGGVYLSGSNDENVIISCYTTNLYGNTNKDFLITQDEAKVQETFDGYDFEQVWGMEAERNDGHPYLRNIPAEDDPNWYADPDSIVAVTGIVLDRSSLTLELGESEQLTASVLPENARNQTVLWRSDDSSVASVDETGMVTANGGGTTTIYAVSEDGGFAASCAVTVNAKIPVFSGGSGTASDPYRIKTAEDLCNVTYIRDAYYQQECDISLTGVAWEPIGSEYNPFSGNYDGLGYAIDGLTVTADDLSWVGLFGYSTGTIKNLKLKNCSVVAESEGDTLYCGGVVGYNAGTISAIRVSGKISAANSCEFGLCCVGGVAGYSSKTIISSAFSGSVRGRVACADSACYAGGLAGYASSALSCKNSGGITATGFLDGDCYAGGILGYATGAVSGSYNGGTIKAEMSRYSFAGGITGVNKSFIRGCVNTGLVDCSTAYKGSSESTHPTPDGNVAVLSGGPEALAGGITGSNFGTVSYCENAGEVKSTSTVCAAYAGGIVGYNNSEKKVTKCKNSGPVTTSSTAGETRAGGIAASSYIDSEVSLCCNYGKVSTLENGVWSLGLAGGVVGCLQYGSMDQCCNHGDVYATATLYYFLVGGLTGHTSSSESNDYYATITDCYNTGDVKVDFTGTNVTGNSKLSGLAGFGGQGNSISNCYNVGKLSKTGSKTDIYGLFYVSGASDYQSEGCYVTALHLSKEGGTLMTAAESLEKDTYAEYDFESVWGIDSEINGGRPYLINLPDEEDTGWYSGEWDVVFPKSVSLDRTEAELHVGETVTLGYTYLPADATEVSWEWSSSNSTVASVTEEGVVTAKSAGTAVITISADRATCSASCVITVTGHDYEIESKDPTCTEDGYSIFTCKLCEYSFEENYLATGHVEVMDGAVEPTCTETGLTEGSHCEVCGETIVAQQTVPAYGHYYGDYIYYEPTCTAAGFREYWCMFCGCNYCEDVEPALGHAFDDYVDAGNGLLVARCGRDCGIIDERPGEPTWSLTDNAITGVEYSSGVVLVALYDVDGRLIAVKFCEKVEWKEVDGVMIYQYVAPEFTEAQLECADKTLCFNMSDGWVPLRDVIPVK